MDTADLPIVPAVRSVDLQDRDATPDVIVELLSKPPEASKLFADGGYGGSSLRGSLAQQVRST